MTQKKPEVPAMMELLKVRPDTSLVEAYNILRDNWIRHLPVVDDQGRIVGIISERDFNRARITGVGPTVESRMQVRFPTGASVGDFMTDRVLTVPLSGEVRQAIDLMLENKVSSCVIVDGDRPIGIVTTDDLLRILKTYIDSPTGSLCERLEAMLKTSPLGVFGYTLSNFGI